MPAYEIPLSPKAQLVTVQLAGVKRKLNFYWNPTSECWFMDVMDDVSTPLIMGIPVVTGLDLLEQFAYMNLGGSIVVQTDHGPLLNPTFENLGVTGHVFFVVTEG